MQVKTREGEIRKIAGMQLAVDAAPLSWKVIAAAAIEQLAATGKEFTSDDVTDLAGLPHENARKANQNNAVGGMLGGAAKRGIIEHVGYTKSRRLKSHATDIRVWRGVSEAE